MELSIAAAALAADSRAAEPDEKLLQPIRRHFILNIGEKIQSCTGTKIELPHIVRQGLRPAAVHALAQRRLAKIRRIPKGRAGLRCLDVRCHAARSDVPEPLLPLALACKAASLAVSPFALLLPRHEAQYGTRQEKRQLLILPPLPRQKVGKEQAPRPNMLDEPFQCRLFARCRKLRTNGAEKHVCRILHAHLLKPAAARLPEMHRRIKRQRINRITHADRPPFASISLIWPSASSSSTGSSPSEKHDAAKSWSDTRP